MTVEEIFTKIASHMLDGVMIHEQLVHYHNFLHLPGFASFHHCQYMEESLNYMSLCSFYLKQYNKLIPDIKVKTPEIIPSKWYMHVRQDIDAATIKSAVKEGLEIWIKWEQETKDLLQKMYLELIDKNEIASACFLSKFINDVTEELAEAEDYYLNKKIINYDIKNIMGEQSKPSRTHFKHLIKRIKKVGEENGFI